MTFSIIFLLSFDILFLGLSYAVRALASSIPVYALTDVSELGGLILSMFVLYNLGWFRKVGYNGRKEWRDLRVLWIGVFIVIFFLLGFGAVIGAISTQLAIFLTLSAILVGLSRFTARGTTSTQQRQTLRVAKS